MKLGLIYAQARNGVIGKQGQLPWHLPEDLAHFKALTQGCPVIMGRKTWDSLPPRFRPLPGRRNWVVTRQPQWQAPGAERASSLEEALTGCEASPQVWVIGGAQLYAQALARAQCAEVTLIDQDFEGDAYAPTLGPAWNEVARSRHISAGGLSYEFIRYEQVS
jgi:dihydrofolate reductase